MTSDRFKIPFLGWRIPGPPGVQVFPEQGAQPPGDPSALAPGEDAPPPIIRMTIRGPSERKQRGPTSSVAPIEVLEPVLKAIRLLIKEDALIPSAVSRRLRAAEKDFDLAGPFEEERLSKAAEQARTVRDSFDNAREVAMRLIIAMIEAEQIGEDTVSLRLVAAYNKVERKATVFSEIKRISEIARNIIGGDASGVRYVKLFFGSKEITTITLRGGR